MRIEVGRMPGRMEDKVRCSFCGKTQEQVRKMIAGSNGVYICDECIDLCAEILEEELDSQLVTRTAKNFEITPRGWELYDCAQSIIKLRDDMVDRWNGNEPKVIRLGVS